ncbi:uncharacterized protein B0I36DRAFT_341704 [Microdochium trichocladiopsis]|uniref:Secreted protein n=1 Tax=Microdochium trichocladiopsis TaxID=1682393 RepID=A0A9P8XRG5_9PEZI|nr:uncharacterized protein B0I36DRAFT_341704 [Microdochium trichocladiopsis]KAH7010597.1 hypothetical protein B0I36DRAFT_341704 [Microdochium trichocladiopsis]
MVLGYVCLCLRPAMSLGCYRVWTGGQYGRGASSLSRYGTRLSQSGIVSVPTWGGSYSARTGSVSVSASLRPRPSHPSCGEYAIHMRPEPAGQSRSRRVIRNQVLCAWPRRQSGFPWCGQEEEGYYVSPF